MAENIYSKLAQMRVELQRMNIKKSGRNQYSGYDYYELADILPPINILQEKYKTCSLVSFTPDMATLTIVNAEAPDEMVVFTSPMAELSLKAANAVQNLGGTETYQRRYLYMAAFEIVENDFFDATQGKESGGKQKAPAELDQLKKYQKAQLSEATANELNLRIAEYAAASGQSNKAVSEAISKALGKKLKEATEEDAKTILSLLNDWQNALQEVM